MNRRHSWLRLAGACVLFAACGPVEEPAEEAVSAPEQGVLEAAHERPGCACQPPVLAAEITPGAAGTSVRAIFDLDGTPLVNVEDETGTNSLWKLVEREDAECGGSRWDAVFLRGGFIGLPLVVAFAIEDGTLYFTANDGVLGAELWKTDGTPEGTVLVEDIQPGGGGSLPLNFLLLGETLYFTADDGEHGRELWKSDGTARGTRLVEDIRPGPLGSEPFGMVRVDDERILFTADDGEHGRELWTSDGTRSGTRLVEDIFPGPMSSEPSSLVQVKPGVVLFAANDGEHGQELWRSNGTPGGTRLVEDIRPGPEGSDALVNSTQFTVVERRLYFSANDGVHGEELWRSDGTPGGTRLVEDIRPGPESSQPGGLKPLDGQLFFSADDGVHGREPWRSEGSEDNTLLLADVFPGPGTSSPSGFSARGKVYFYAVSPEFGHELWVTDGTRRGTHLVKDIRPGPASAFAGDPNDPFPVGGGLILSAFEDEHGVELWWTDGTEAGTMMADLFPGPASSDPVNFSRVGEWVFFTADDGVHGREVWALPVACFPKTGGR
ncbi:ELWxxDGT repeat protein [Archangium sp. Cb G35]|uniref:ELWxxDGT repeat protein n=1 Tax=Archangium sp. Cb G35 TaxID=1920190 RepID=UPI000ADA47A7|nr:ELWxxDGT repeat protein [Archangium sp. Cb G35]